MRTDYIAFLLQVLIVMLSLVRISSKRVVSTFQRTRTSRGIDLSGASFRTKHQRGCSSLTSALRRASNHNPAVRQLSLHSTQSQEDASDGFFANTTDFASLGIQSKVLLKRIEELGLTRPTAVQAAAFGDISSRQGDTTVGAETGSGKTLAYLFPIIDDILLRKQKAVDENDGLGYDYARAIILVPNKELVQQVVRMAVPLSGGRKSLIFGGSTLADKSLSEHDDNEDNVREEERIRLAIFPGGLKNPLDFQPFRSSIALGGKEPPVDLVITTPASLGPLGLKPANIDMFADIQTLVIDEADMLLDGGYIRALENVLVGFRRADRLDSSLGVKKTQHVFVAATLPDMGLRSVDAYLQKKFPEANRVTMPGMHNARHYGLSEQTVWIEEESKKSRMEQLVEMLQKPLEEGGLQGEKTMVFLNSVDDVEGASQALLRAGMNVLPYHAKIPLSERVSTLDRFRRYSPQTGKDDDTVNVLVCTDLAARGLDVPGVNAIVQLQFAGNVVAHLHRMGRCGRAGQRTGRGIVFYGEKERDLVEVVKEAEEQQERMVLQGDVIDISEENQAGTVKNAFSRRRGFTKKRKKLRREVESAGGSN